jgi:hypothetical protein
VTLGRAPRVARPALDLGLPALFAVVLEERQQSPQRVRRVADDGHLHRVTEREVARLDIDLHAAGLPRFG